MVTIVKDFGYGRDDCFSSTRDASASQGPGTGLELEIFIRCQKPLSSVRCLLGHDSVVRLVVVHGTKPVKISLVIGFYISLASTLESLQCDCLEGGVVICLFEQL